MFIYVIILCLLIAADQLTKYAAVIFIKNSPKELISGVLELYYLENTGAAFSILRNNVTFFTVVTFIVLIAIVYLYIRMPDDRKYLPLRLILVFITAGAIGNLIDRIKFGYVRDFIYFSLIDFPVFNVADIYVTVSAFVLLFLMIFKYKEHDFDFISPKNGKSSSGTDGTEDK